MKAVLGIVLLVVLEGLQRATLSPPPGRPVRSPEKPRICLFSVPQPWWDSSLQMQQSWNSQCTRNSVSVQLFSDVQVKMGFTISVKDVFWLAHWPSLAYRVLRLRLQQHFRWVQLRWDTEPLNGMLGRHLRRKLLHKVSPAHYLISCGKTTRIAIQL